MRPKQKGSPISGIRAVAFDCDGVMFDTARANRAYYNRVLAHFGRPPMNEEQFLYTHPAIQETAVYGVSHPQKGETVRAAIVLKENASASAEDFQAFCRENLANYKVPATIDIVAELPKSATGKILKRILREQAAADRD